MFEIGEYAIYCGKKGRISTQSENFVNPEKSIFEIILPGDYKPSIVMGKDLVKC